MQQEAVVLCAYLASRAQQPTDVPAAHRDPLIEVILKRYAGVWQPALRGQTWLAHNKDLLGLCCVPEDAMSLIVNLSNMQGVKAESCQFTCSL